LTPTVRGPMALTIGAKLVELHVGSCVERQLLRVVAPRATTERITRIFI
jgi:hypothetical protein